MFNRRFWNRWGLLIAVAAFVIGLPALAQPNVTAEAIQFANLRAGLGTDTDVVGRIDAGTAYPVLGQSAEYPWLLLGDPTTRAPIGWVFRDVVTLSGSLGDVLAYGLSGDWQPLANGVFVPPPLLQAAPNFDLTPSLTFPTPFPETPVASLAAALNVTPTLPPTATLAAQVVGTAQGEINVRYGPGIEYPRVGVAQGGDPFEITAWHTQLPWVQIRYDGSPNGLAWVQADLLTYSGDRFSLPGLSQTQFNLPTLTPTPSVLQTAGLLAAEPVPLSSQFAALGDQLWNLMLGAGFDPATSRLGTLFVMDLQTGEAFSFGTEFAFSGMSLNKIAVLTEVYGQLDAPPGDVLAYDIAEAMTCSENTSSNDLLTYIGGGSPFSGARQVTTRLRGLGLQDTFIAAPYTPDARITPEPITLPVTTADQTRTEPDPSNQMTADELGGLLGAVYQCAVHERGALLESYPEAFTPAECRQVLNTMTNNRINALIEMGVPEGTRIAHKHGWIDDTHGDAGIVFTPGGDFVIVAAVRNPVWLNFEESFPLIAEISRTVYNYFNPDALQPAIREGEVSDVCNVIGSPLVEQLLSSDVALPAGPSEAG
jgi:uncharacterized protein YraI